MSCHKIDSRTPSRFIALLLAFVAALSAPAAFALDTGDIIVTKISGDVRITFDGTPRTLKAGAALETPATLETGKDGAIELAQGQTTISVGPDTKLDFPRLESKSGPVDRIVQQRGNAFYKIGKRGGRQLRVETPFLVGCIKGTQFNVNVQDGSSTISLFEGRLEVHAIDESDVVDLVAGEVATRKSDDASINVIKMNVHPAPAPARPTTSTGGDTHRELREDLVARSEPVAVDLPSPNEAPAGAPGAAPMPGTNTGVVSVDTGANVDSGTDQVADTGAGAITGVGTPATPAPEVVVAAPPTPIVDVSPGTGGLVDPIKNDDVALGLDDGNNGHGNDPDHDDSGNPGHSSHGKGPGPSDDTDPVAEETGRHKK